MNRGQTKRDRRERQTIEMADKEWRQLKGDATEYGLSGSVFVVQLWRNWRLRRDVLLMVSRSPESAIDTAKETA